MGQYYFPTIIRPTGEIYHFDPNHFGSGLKLTEHAYVGNGTVNAVLSELHDGDRLAWVGDYADFSEFCRINDRHFTSDNQLFVDMLSYIMHHDGHGGNTLFRPPRYILNTTKNEYIDMEEWTVDHVPAEYILHPLPLLCAIGNGAGGGDYYGPDEEACGRWAFDLIELSDEEPAGMENITGWYDFRE